MTARPATKISQGPNTRRSTAVTSASLQAPAVTVLAFVPMLLTSIGYSELNKADPDCGTTFTWATRTFGPRSGWAGQVGGAFVIAVIAALVGVACYLYCRITRPAFFRKKTLTRATPTLTPDQ